MKLTGKCKEDFEKWLINQEWFEDYFVVKDEPVYDGNYHRCIDWNEFIDSMQYGVMVDFFDSVEIFIHSFDDTYDIYVKEEKSMEGKWSITRQEAREKAIEKANEIYNLKQ